MGKAQGVEPMVFFLALSKRGFFLATIFLLVSCVSVEKEQRAEFIPPVYPPPPDEPRFVYEQTLMHSGQLNPEDPKESRMRRMLTGESRIEAVASLAKPFDVEVCQGKVYVSDTVSRSVHVFDYPAKKYRVVGVTEPGSLSKPMGMAVDGNCNLYVLDATQKRVVVYDALGNYINAVGGSKWFFRPSYVAVDRTGSKVFIVDTGLTANSNDGHKVRVFDVQSGEHLYDIGERGAEQGQFNLPKDITLGPDNRIYIVDSGNFRVQVLEEDGSFVRSFGSVGRRFGQFSRPKGIDLDSEGNIYVSDASFANIQIFNSQGQLLLAMGERGHDSSPGKYLLTGGLDVDEDGRIYFVDQFFRKVDIFRPVKLSKEQGYLGTLLSTGSEK